MHKCMICELVPLHQNLSHLEECCELLNKEWKMSHGIRSRLLMKSDDNFPCSLILLMDGNLVGHVRLSRVVGEAMSLVLTSVIIVPQLRGTGLGRKLLELTDEFAIQRGYNSLCLSSNGTEKFYKKCGYFECEPIQQSHNNALNEKLLMLQTKEKIDLNMKKCAMSVVDNFDEEISDPKEFASPPPPPPAPPLPPFVSPLTMPPVPSLDLKKSVAKTWMRKGLTRNKPST